MSSKTDKKKAMVPKLRFPEFRNAGPWKVKRLGEIFRFIPTNSLSRSRLTYDSGQVRNIHYVDIHTKFRALFYIEKEDVPFINDELDAERFDENSFCIPGDVIFADASEDVDDIGKAIEVVNLGGEKIVSGLHTLHARQKEVVYVIGFSGYLFQSSAIRKQIQRESQGAKVLGISATRLEKIKIFVPKKREQQKIVDCFSTLDVVIEVQTKKLEALKLHKKGLMQQLFPREGEITPRLRFPEFRDRGPWDVKCLGEVFQERNERNGSGLELLSVTLSDGIVKASQLDRKNNASYNLSNYKKVYPNDIVYNSMRMWQGASGVSNWHGIVSPAYTVVKPLENHNSLFWAYYFKLSESIEKFVRYSQGVTSDTWNLKFPAFSVIRMAFPSLPEQQKAADSLSSLDEVIDLEAKRLEALKAHKKGLMQQLFPQEVG